MVLAKLSNQQHEMHAESVSARSEKQTLTQTQQPGVTPEQIHAHSQHGITEVFTVQIDGEIAEMENAGLGNKRVKRRQNA